MSFHTVQLPVITDITWYGLYAVNDRFVVLGFHASGSAGRLAWSVTGELGTWNVVTLPAEPAHVYSGTSEWDCIAYANGLYVLTAHGSRYYTTSTDLVTFSAATAIPATPITGSWTSGLDRPFIEGVVFGGGKFLFWSQTTAHTFTWDGVSTWAAGGTGFKDTSGNQHRVIHTGTRFITGAYNGDRLPRYSADGLTWTQGTDGVTPELSFAGSVGVGTRNGVVLAVGPTGFYRSTDDGATWELCGWFDSSGLWWTTFVGAVGLSGIVTGFGYGVYTTDEGDTWYSFDVGDLSTETTHGGTAVIGDKYAFLGMDTGTLWIGTPTTQPYATLQDDDELVVNTGNAVLVKVTVPHDATSAVLTWTSDNSEDYDFDIDIDTPSRAYYDGAYASGDVESYTFTEVGRDYYITITGYGLPLLGTLAFDITYPDAFWTGFIGCEAEND